MNHLLFICISVAVAACIGGLTNYLAIKMLFHPREAVRWGGRKLPFTPGLIPKRKEEIARSLGAVVGDYLVTSGGLIEMFGKPEFRGKIEDKIASLVKNGAGQDLSLNDLLGKVWEPEQIARVRTRLAEALPRWTRRGVTWLWEEQGWSAKTLSDLVPEWDQAHKEQLCERLARYLLGSIESELSSPAGSRLIRGMIEKFLDQSGGFMGTLAGIFMDQDRMTDKVKASIIEGLGSPAAQAAVTRFICDRVGTFEQMSLSELIASYIDPDPGRWIADKAAAVIRPDEWLEHFASLPLRAVMARHEEALLQHVPAVSGFLLNLLENNMERIFQAIRLPELVEQQVQKFPTERLERIILSVSGREFQAITWLGALLGGVIGLIQSIFILWLEN